MQSMAIIIVFSTDMKKVLMCHHQSLHADNFVGGKVDPGETSFDAAYRELREETGITSDDIELRIVRHEVVTESIRGDWDLLVTCGVLKHDVVLYEEKDPLFWADVDDTGLFLNAYGNGDRYTFLKEALIVLNDISTWRSQHTVK